MTKLYTYKQYTIQEALAKDVSCVICHNIFK